MDPNRAIDKAQSRTIRDKIREVLMSQWDPIGVKDEPMAADEYDMYIGNIYGLLKNDVSTQAISDHLREIEIVRMSFADEQVPQHIDVAITLKQIQLR